jgi:hypothetical protein
MAPSKLGAWRSSCDRVSLKELLAHYAKPLQELTQVFHSAFASHPKTDPVALDEVFILRYLLSRKGDVAASAACIQQALDWRRANLPLIHAAADLTKPPALSQESLQKLNCYMAAGIHTPTTFGDLVLIIRAACVNFEELVKDLDSLEIYMMYLAETCYQYCDNESRERGYFVKMFVVNDMNGFSPNPNVMKKLATVRKAHSKRSEFLYPQALGMCCIVNAPANLAGMFKFISPWMSKGFVEKFHLHGTLIPDPSRITAKDLPLPFMGDDAATMPSFLGGCCECEGGCIGHNVSNSTPPPPRKTPNDLPMFASLTNFVQTRFLQKRRDEVAKAKGASITASAQLQTHNVTDASTCVINGCAAPQPDSSPVIEPTLAETELPKDRKELVPSIQHALKSNESKMAETRQVDVLQSTTLESAMRKSVVALSPEQSGIQIQTDVDIPMTCGFFCCC